jgi:hypothetical protein
VAPEIAALDREELGPAAALVKNIRGVGYKVEE